MLRMRTRFMILVLLGVALGLTWPVGDWYLGMVSRTGGAKSVAAEVTTGRLHTEVVVRFQDPFTGARSEQRVYDAESHPNAVAARQVWVRPDGHVTLYRPYSGRTLGVIIVWAGRLLLVAAATAAWLLLPAPTPTPRRAPAGMVLTR